MKKNFILLLILILTVLNIQIVKADDTNSNFDYTTTIVLNGKDKTTGEVTKEKNVPMVKPINKYYKELIKITKNNTKTNCEVFFDSNFHKSAIKNYANNYFLLIIIVGIIILVILSSMDFIKAITSKDEDLIKQATNSTKYRMISAVILILLPVISGMIINYIDYLNENKDNTTTAKKCEKMNIYTTKNTTIKDKTWGNVLLSPSVKANKLFIGWTANKNGPSIIFNEKVDTSNLIKGKLKLYSLFMNTNKEIEKYNNITLHNRGSKLKHQNMSKEKFIKSTVKKGFNYYVDFDEWYYSKQTGKIYKGLKKINKKTYYFGDDGAVRFGWVTIKKDKYYFNVKGEMVFGEQNIGGVTYNFDKKTGKLLEDAEMTQSSSKKIPTYLLKEYLGSSYDPSIVIADETGNILASRKADTRREGASTTKLFTAYAAVNLLDVNNDKITGTSYANNLAGQFNHGNLRNNEKMSVSKAIVKNFPGSSNEVADSIPSTIGYKYYKCDSDEEAFKKGMKKINEFLKSIGCTNSYLNNGSGLTTHGMNQFTGAYGYAKSGETHGHTAKDLALVAIKAMNNQSFINAYANYSSCENRIGSYPKCRTLARNKNTNGLYFIKSGTGYAAHGIWGFNRNGKRYFIAILGLKTSNNKNAFAKALYKWSIKEFKL